MINSSKIAASLRSVSRLPVAKNLRHFSASAQPTLDVEFPGIPPLSPASSHPKPETKITTLSNGLRVATEETYGQVATIGMFIDAGSRYETHDNNGMSHLIEHMAFKSTDNRSHLRLVRDMEEIGATVGAASSRECIMYTGECLREDVEKVVDVMADSILRPKLAPWDIDAQREIMGFELESLEENAQSLLTEVLHSAAYGENSPLGRSLWCPHRNLGKLSDQDLKEFMKRYFKKDRMVLAAAGVEHESFAALAEKYFAEEATYDSLSVGDVPAQSSEYQGGIKLVESESEFTHVALGFNPGSWHSDDLIDICTLHFLLGGGGSFSAGGPGKGMYSRLYLNVLNNYNWMDSAIAFNSLYNDTGLFGIYGSCIPQKAGELVNVFADELLKLKNGSLAEEEVSRAKNQLKSSMLMKLESRQVLFEDIGRQILTYNKRETPEQICQRVDAVTPESLKKAAEKMLKTKPTLAAFGDVTTIPKYDLIVKAFQ